MTATRWHWQQPATLCHSLECRRCCCCLQPCRRSSFCPCPCPCPRCGQDRHQAARPRMLRVQLLHGRRGQVQLWQLLQLLPPAVRATRWSLPHQPPGHQRAAAAPQLLPAAHGRSEAEGGGAGSAAATHGEGPSYLVLDTAGNDTCCCACTGAGVGRTAVVLWSALVPARATLDTCAGCRSHPSTQRCHPQRLWRAPCQPLVPAR